MYAKLFIILALAAVALGRGYPPGVHPAVCPDFPLCDIESLTKFTLDGQPIPEWMYNPSILPVAPADPNTKVPAAAPAPALAPAPLRLSIDGRPIPESRTPHTPRTYCETKKSV